VPVRCLRSIPRWVYRTRGLPPHMPRHTHRAILPRRLPSHRAHTSFARFPVFARLIWFYALLRHFIAHTSCAHLPHLVRICALLRSFGCAGCVCWFHVYYIVRAHAVPAFPPLHTRTRAPWMVCVPRVVCGASFVPDQLPAPRVRVYRCASRTAGAYAHYVYAHSRGCTRAADRTVRLRFRVCFFTHVVLERLHASFRLCRAFGSAHLFALRTRSFVAGSFVHAFRGSRYVFAGTSPRYVAFCVRTTPLRLDVCTFTASFAAGSQFRTAHAARIVAAGSRGSARHALVCGWLRTVYQFFFFAGSRIILHWLFYAFIRVCHAFAFISSTCVRLVAGSVCTERACIRHINHRDPRAVCVHCRAFWRHLNTQHLCLFHLRVVHYLHALFLHFLVHSHVHILHHIRCLSSHTATVDPVTVHFTHMQVLPLSHCHGAHCGSRALVFINSRFWFALLRFFARTVASSFRMVLPHVLADFSFACGLPFCAAQK